MLLKLFEKGTKAKMQLSEVDSIDTNAVSVLYAHLLLFVKDVYLFDRDTSDENKLISEIKELLKLINNDPKAAIGQLMKNKQEFIRVKALQDDDKVVKPVHEKITLDLQEQDYIDLAFM